MQSDSQPRPIVILRDDLRGGASLKATANQRLFISQHRGILNSSPIAQKYSRSARTAVCAVRHLCVVSCVDKSSSLRDKREVGRVQHPDEEQIPFHSHTKPSPNIQLHSNHNYGFRHSNDSRTSRSPICWEHIGYRCREPHSVPLQSHRHIRYV